MTTALITGANRGLGRQTAHDLAALGWTVWVGARDRDRGEATARDLAPVGDVRAVQLDVTDDASVDAAVTEITRTDTGLDVLVNNAGIIGARVPVVETGAQDFLACFGVNLLGPVRVTRAFLPLLEQSDHPRVVMVSSGMGSLAVTTDPDRVESSFVALVYPASKAALNMVTTQYAKALPQMGINAVDPGWTATDLNGFTGPKSVEEGARPIVRLATIDPDGPTGGFFDAHGTVSW